MRHARCEAPSASDRNRFGFHPAREKSLSLGVHPPPGVGAPASLVRDVSFRGPRKVDGLTEILKALTALYVAVGFWGTLVFLLAVIGALFSWSRLEDRELKELHRDLVNEKEKQIQRLAEDNRMWRS